MRILVALSGGVDSSVAASRLVADGHDVTAITLLLWGGARQGSSCSTADADAAQAAADALGVELRVGDLRDEFNSEVIGSFVEAAEAGRTANPCITCNKTFKVDHLFAYAEREGFDAVATGHHARVVSHMGRRWLARSRDSAKDQSYVLSMLDGNHLDRLILPLGDLTKDQVRELAQEAGLPAADRPDSMDLCFSPADVLAGRATPAVLVGPDGTNLGEHPALERVTVGQRRGLGVSTSEALYVSEVRADTRQIKLAPRRDLRVSSMIVSGVRGPYGPPGGRVLVQRSAHGAIAAATFTGDGKDGGTVVFDEPQRRGAPGQTVVFYDTDRVIGSGVAE